MFKIDMQSRTPIYQQLRDKIIEMILLGMMEAGDPLPSVRTMARDLGVNPNTVSKAYQDLERGGVIYSVAGKGSFVSGTDELGRLAKVNALEKLRELAVEVQRSGITLEEAVATIQAVYEKEATK